MKVTQFPIRHRTPIVIGQPNEWHVPAGETAQVRWFWRDSGEWSKPENRIGPCTVKQPPNAQYYDLRGGPSEPDGAICLPPKDEGRRTRANYNRSNVAAPIPEQRRTKD